MVFIQNIPMNKDQTFAGILWDTCVSR